MTRDQACTKLYEFVAKYNIENDTKPQNESEKPESQKTESTESNRGK